MRDMRRKRNMTSARFSAIVCCMLAFALFISVSLGLAGLAVSRAEGEKTTLALTSDSFASVSADSSRLWRLKIDEEDGKTNYSKLLDKTIYRGSEGNIVRGELDDAYARFRDKTLDLEFDPAYKVAGDVDVATLLKSGVTLSYSHHDADTSALITNLKGSRQGVMHIKTTMTADFTNSSYALSGAKSDNYSITDENTLVVVKEWYIVNVANLLRDEHGIYATFSDINYGDDYALASPRPGHGNTVVWTLSRGKTRLARFAVVFEGGKEKLYETTTPEGITPDMAAPLSGTFKDRLKGLSVGDYTLTGELDEYVSGESHTHWWEEDGAILDDYGTYYHAITHTFAFKVMPFDISEPNVLDEADKKISVDRYVAQYTGQPVEPWDIVVRFKGTPLKLGDDYDLEFSNNINSGIMGVKIIGRNNFKGQTTTNKVVIGNVENSWLETPHINRWIYGNYDRKVNTISAVPKYLYDDDKVLFSVYKADGEDFALVEGMQDFSLVRVEGEDELLVSDEIAKLMASLDAGAYRLRARLDDTTSYGSLDSVADFKILQAENRWVSAPSVIQWASDDYDASIKHFIAAPLLGEESAVKLTVKDEDGNIVYDSSRDSDSVLASLKKGKYTLTAAVAETVNYTGLSTDVEFEVLRGSTEIIIAIAIISAFDVLLIVALVVLFVLARRRKS